MRIDPDFRKINDLLSKVNEINDKLIDQSDFKSDQICELNALIEKDIWMVDYYGKQINKISEAIDSDVKELLSYLDKIKHEIIKVQNNKPCAINLNYENI